MQKRSDDRLVAYLDGELEAAEQREVEAWLDGDPAARDRLAALAQSAKLVRRAFDEVMHEPLPERLIAAARGETAPADRRRGRVRRLPRRPIRGAAAALAHRAAARGLAVRPPDRRRRRLSRRRPVRPRRVPAAAGGPRSRRRSPTICGSTTPPAISSCSSAPATTRWSMCRRPATRARRCKRSARACRSRCACPTSNPGASISAAPGWSSSTAGPAAQLVYTTENKAIGPLALIIGSSKQPDIAPTFDRRQDVNLLYWRHQGRAYALVGQADIGYLWGIGNDVAWQLDAI